ncbi:MAG: LptF/LptG family permease [Myxococcota bacterium]|nr:LptF/LptG family permease [Myxococcota bacterium]
MTTFDRYLLKEMLAPLGAGMGLAFVVIAFVQLIQISDSTTGFGVTSSDLVMAVLYSLPPTIGLLIPIGLLFATLITLGRLEQDNELLAHSASGFSLIHLSRAPLILAVILSGFSAIGTVYGEPWGVSGLRDLLAHGAKRALADGVKPGIFYQWTPELTFYARGRDNGELVDWVLAERNGEREMIVSAERGSLIADEDNLELQFAMSEGTVFRRQVGKEPVLMQFKHGTYNLDIAKLVGNKAKTISPVNALSIEELWRKSHSEKKKRKRAHFSVAFHRKWAFPIATIIFSALAVPLAILTGRQGRGFGVLSSLGLVAGYYYIGRAAELSARKLELTPWLAAWLPNIIGVLLIALFWWFVQRRRR